MSDVVVGTVLTVWAVCTLGCVWLARMLADRRVSLGVRRRHDELVARGVFHLPSMGRCTICGWEPWGEHD